MAKLKDIRHKFAVELYSFRRELEADFAGTIRALRKMGWEAVQMDGLRGNSAEDIAAALKETGMKVAGMHVSLDRMLNDTDNVVYEGLLFGTKDIFCNSLPEELQNEEGYRYVKRSLLDLSARLNGLGFRVGYHNHEFEFLSKVDNRTAYDYLMLPEENRFIYPEVDTYWVQYAEIDPLSVIKRFPDKMPILHLKDMKPDKGLTYPESLAEIGTGMIDFVPILQWGEANGTEWYVVEQDRSFLTGGMMESYQISFNNLLKLQEQL